MGRGGYPLPWLTWPPRYCWGASVWEGAGPPGAWLDCYLQCGYYLPHLQIQHKELIKNTPQAQVVMKVRVMGPEVNADGILTVDFSICSAEDRTCVQRWWLLCLGLYRALSLHDLTHPIPQLPSPQDKPPVAVV